MDNTYLESIMNTLSFDKLREFRLDVLSKVHALSWTKQGFGMYRTYLGKGQDFRLNIWHSSLRNPDLEKTESDIHSHPWDFSSKIIYGKLINMRYQVFKVSNMDTTQGSYENYFNRKLIKPGLACTDLETEPQSCLVMEYQREILSIGDVYSQYKEEVHKTRTEGLTITLNLRIRGEKDEAYTFWRKGTAWTNCKPSVVDSQDVYNLLKNLDW